MVKQFGSAGKTLAVVSDSYDIYHAVSALWGEQLKEEVREEPLFLAVVSCACLTEP
jgi:nicotinamide phosphoribosyltransferase